MSGFIVLPLLGVSIALNVILLLKLRKPPRQETYDCQALLHDLLGGNALVRVTRVAPSDVFIRSPRGDQ